MVNETETCKDPYYDTLNEAKIVCDSIKDCIAITQLHCTECYGKSGFGIGKDCNFYYIIRNGQRILETELEGHVSAVYKKKENIGDMEFNHIKCSYVIANKIQLLYIS